VKLEEYLYPETEEAFEDLVVELVRAEFRPPLPPTRFGRKGQRQKGIDLNWRLENGSHQAAQCKDYLKTKLTRAHIDHDLALAHTLTPPLEALIFVTSGDRDSSLSEYVANCTLHNRPTVAVWFWQDVVAMLERHQLLGRLSDDWIARRLPSYLARNGLSLQPLPGAAAMGPAPDPNASALQREMESALSPDSGRQTLNSMRHYVSCSLAPTSNCTMATKCWPWQEKSRHLVYVPLPGSCWHREARPPNPDAPQSRPARARPRGTCRT
jgi:hypothetical protein